MKELFSKADEAAILRFARAVISDRLGIGEKLPEKELGPVKSGMLHQKRGVFVTLHKEGKLRGCIGNIEPCNTLLEGIRENAEHAAFEDSRFPPLNPEEVDQIDIEISILTPPETVDYADAGELVSRLKPRVDGVVLKKNHQKATFLPQVWEQLTDPESFLGHLCMKAGLQSTEWKKGELEIQTYQVYSFEE